MSLPGSPPPLNKVIFLVADAALLGAAWLIAADSVHPLRSTPLFAILACVLAAAFIGAFPFVLDYTRRQEAALDDHQRSLEALAQTVSTAAEQIGIAAAGLNEIAQLADRNLRAAQELPSRIAGKLAELETKLDGAREEEREELERELASLRASESERLAATVEKIARAAADWSKAESAGLRHVVAARTFISELEQKIAALKAAAVAATAPATPAAAASGAGNRPPDAHSTSPSASVGGPPAPAQPGSIGAAANEAPRPPRRAASKAAALTAAAAPQSPLNPVQPAAAPPSGSGGSPLPSTPASGGDAASTPTAHSPVPHEPEPSAAPKPAAAPPAAATLPNEPVSGADASADTALNGEATVAPSPDPDAAQVAPRKRPLRKPPLEEPTLGLDDAALRSAAPGPVAAPSPDGATRLLVTAYIGIGNRLFIRGDGPGLSWDEGVPLQFVSIGKWRWETRAATDTVQFKLYKNDRDPCNLPTDRIEAGQQQELTASF